MANTYDFDAVIDRRGTDSLKWRWYADHDVIPMTVADMDFASPPAVIEALQARVARGVFGYTFRPDELAEVIVAMLKNEHAWEVDPEWLVWLPSLHPGLNLACRAVGEEGEDVMTVVPVYPAFLVAPELSQRHLVTVPLAGDNGRWVFDFERLEDTITPRTRLFILCNPHNPVGRVYTREELHMLADICLRHNIIICSDEIHSSLVLDEDKRHIPIATLSPEIAGNTITLMAPSKTFNIPGLGYFFAIIPNNELRTRFTDIMKDFVPGGPGGPLAYVATIAAYRDSHDWHQALLAYLRRNRDAVERAVAEMPGLSMAHVEATYLAWVDARALGVEKPSEFFGEGGVRFNYGERFGGPGFVRFNFGCPRSRLQEALKRMKTQVTTGTKNRKSK